MKAIIYTLGCKVNTYESSEICENLRRGGWLASVGGANVPADVYIINSCTVTEESSRKTKQLLRKIKREHPSAVTLLTGCYPQAFPSEAAALAEADIVIGNRSNADIPALLDEYIKTPSPLRATKQHEKGESFSADIISETDGHTRAFLKIQDGCNRYCSYCIIPTARGRSRSRPLDEITRCCEKLSDNGFSEIVLVGINLSAYGRDLENLNLADAVEAAAKAENVKRIRLGSLEPDHITKELSDRLALCDKLCPQFHISMQSGCDEVLKRMNRHYTHDEFEELVVRLRNTFTDCSITTDIICGFPGETEEEFMQTVKFAEKIGFEKAHIFPYSPRAGTRAADMPNQIDKKEKERRCAYLAAVCEKSRSAFLSSYIGKTVDVLFETPKNGLQRGYTANYIPVTVAEEENAELCGEILPVLITDTGTESCIGALIKNI